ADGLLRPADPAYPKDLLRHRLTRIEVRITGQIAETAVYQEFVNEWHQATNAVYSFPLPPDARATAFFYWYNDICYQAVLKVKEQAVNPGTGEGGIAAQINAYIGRNGIKVFLQNIPAGGIQKVQLHYISLCSYFDGELSYRFPLNTQDFVTYPLDLLSASIDVTANSAIQSYGITSHKNWTTLVREPQHVIVELNQSKAYLNQDLVFTYRIPNDELSIDFYPVANDTMDGHFVLMINPDESVDTTRLLKKRVVFLLDNSSSMAGFKLSQSKEAIGWCLNMLKPDELFNIVIFNNSVSQWSAQLMPATPTNLQSAKTFLAGVKTGSGSNLHTALQQALALFKDKNLCNSILLFTDGFSVVDPIDIESRNAFKAGIFCIGIGEDLDRAKLEMVALRNYGFVTYLNETDNLLAGIQRVFRQINQPILMDTRIEFGMSDAYAMLPSKFPSIYRGFRFFLTGRYHTAFKSAFSIAGYSATGIQAYDFYLDFAAANLKYRFAESIWAKEMIDDIERQIAVFGETDSLKKLDIELSLKYNIRCKYTAYIADYATLPPTRVITEEDFVPIAKSYLIGNYPNPFNSTTSIQFYLDRAAEGIKYKFLRIYNLLGQLVAVIDISHLGPGMHIIKFDGRDSWGNELPSGIYICQLVVGKEVSTIRISLVK
ncbi:MAG: VIT domain-containing protein, partial [candidate division KSB1 bacterium]|nr:VIT domain-containing protein [candidate division KSB1 bacterium]